MPIRSNTGLSTGSLTRRLQSGAGLIEALIAVPITLVACLLVLQITLLYRAKLALNYATQEAARVGSMSNGRVVPRFLTDLAGFAVVAGTKGLVKVASSMIPGAATTADGNEPNPAATGSTSNAAPPPSLPNGIAAKGVGFLKDLGRGMLRYGDSSVLQGFINGITPFYVKGTSFIDVAKGQIDAYGDAMMNSCILYHNPTHSAFIDYGFMEVEGVDKYVLQIPADLLRYRIPSDVDPSGKGIGYFKKHGIYLSDETDGLATGLSAMSAQDATLLSIEIKYSAKMQVPIAREIIIGITKLHNSLFSNETGLGAAFISSAIDHGRWPMSSYATYRMRSPVHWHFFYPLGNISNVRSTGIEAFDGIQALWNVIISNAAPTAPGQPQSWDPAMPQIGFCPGLLIEAMGAGNGGHLAVDTWVGKDYDEYIFECSKTNSC